MSPDVNCWFVQYETRFTQDRHGCQYVISSVSDVSSLCNASCNSLEILLSFAKVHAIVLHTLEYVFLTVGAVVNLVLIHYYTHVSMIVY